VGSLSAAQATGKYIYFTITNDGSTEAEIDSVVLEAQVSTTGPTNVQMQYAIGSGADQNFAGGITITSTGTNIRLRFVPTFINRPHLCAGQTATFKLYGWNSTTWTAAGTLRISDNTLVGANWATAVSTLAGATPNPACSGQNIALTGNRSNGIPGYTYTWNGPSGYFAPVRNPVITNAPTTATGVYTFTTTDAWGCSSSDTESVTVNPSPATPIATPSGTVTICSFDSVVLTAPSGFTYQWDTGAFATPWAIPGATNVTYTARVSGRFRVEVTNSFGCTTRGTPPTTVVVNAAASPAVTASGPLSFCTGGSVTLTSAAAGSGLTFQWYDSVATGPAVAITGATSASYVVTAGGRYFVRVTNAIGCVTQSSLYIVVEISLPTISTTDTTAFCQGGFARLALNITSGATGVQYQWKRNSVNIPGATNTTYNASATGNYTCFVNIPGSCAVTTNSIYVDVHPTPTPLITFNGVRFVTYNYYTTYQWYLNTVVIPGATTYMVTPHNIGSYRVFVTDTFGCSVLSVPYNLNTLAIENVNSAVTASVYPNPATDVLHIQASAEVAGTITSIEGKVVIKINGTSEVSLSALPAGLYLVNLYDAKGNRVLVEKLEKR
jgi:hypothetical protein